MRFLSKNVSVDSVKQPVCILQCSVILFSCYLNFLTRTPYYSSELIFSIQTNFRTILQIFTDIFFQIQLMDIKMYPTYRMTRTCWGVWMLNLTCVYVSMSVTLTVISKCRQCVVIVSDSDIIVDFHFYTPFSSEGTI